MGRSVVLIALATLAVACAGFSAFAGWKLYGYNRQAQWLTQRGQSEGESYVQTLAPEYAASQLDTFDRRRVLVVETARWRRYQLLALVGLVFFGFAAYVARAVRTIRGMEEDVPQGVSADKAAENVAASGAVSSR